jgi:uncharacterized membrane protein
MMRVLVLAAAIIAAAASACSSGDTIDTHPCPTGGTTLTYASFGQPFLDQWCERCHAASAPSRNGAPPNVTFDTHDDVLKWRDRIFARAADHNSSMPPGPDGPPDADRQRLADWLSCGAR